MKPPESLQGALNHGIRPGLERVTALLGRLGDPQERVPVIHVAGTNGKGSVGTLVANILEEAGHRVARYTSPHLVSYCERFSCDGLFIAPEQLEALLDRVQQEAQALDPSGGPVTEFELLTVAGFLWFAERAPDVLVLEAGLGGRLDATNVLKAPALTVITRIARDHTEWLGEDLGAIAREKAGILRPGVPLVTSARGVARDVIREVADGLGVPVHEAPAANWLGHGTSSDRVEIGGRVHGVGLRGPYQAENVALAFAAVEVLAQRGWSLDDGAIARGLSAAWWPGRFDRWTSPDGERFLFDGAHNLDGALALASALQADPRPRVMLFGALGDKDPQAMLAALRPFVDSTLWTAPPSPRAFDPTLVEAEDPAIRCEKDWREALQILRQEARGREIVVAGSLYLVGAVYEALGRSVGG